MPPGVAEGVPDGPGVAEGSSGAVVGSGVAEGSSGAVVGSGVAEGSSGATVGSGAAVGSGSAVGSGAAEGSSDLPSPKSVTGLPAPAACTGPAPDMIIAAAKVTHKHFVTYLFFILAKILLSKNISLFPYYKGMSSILLLSVAIISPT